jgi:divalent metal cation (Fe/Co/Zn/Cd) transporter
MSTGPILDIVRPPTTTTATGEPTPITRERYVQLARRVRLLSWASLGIIGFEGAVAIIAGILAGSIGLIAFGLDSVVEGSASVVLVWRFSRSRMFSQAAETRAQKLVAIQFFILAPYVAVESVRALAEGRAAEVSLLGIALTVFSVITMPVLGIAKQRLAVQIGSAATKGEGRQNMLCTYLAAALLVSLVANAVVGAWWLDPVVGLLIAGVAVKEGVEAWGGETCADCQSPLALLNEHEQSAACEDGCRGDMAASPAARP